MDDRANSGSAGPGMITVIVSRASRGRYQKKALR